MNIETGEIKMLAEGENTLADYIRVRSEDITRKQIESMQVSPHDNRSVLGKVFTSERKKRKWLAKAIKKGALKAGQLKEMK